MKTRIIHTKVWKDEWFVALSKEAKILWIYLLTNDKINISGIYEISEREILFDTGITDVKKCKEELNGKAIFKDKWVYIPNVDIYNNYRFSEKNEKAYNRELEMLPEEIRLFFGKDFTLEDFQKKKYIKYGDTYQHIKVAEKHLGRKLYDNEVVHHIDRNPSNNNPDNLAVVDKLEHIKIHKNELKEEDCTSIILVSDYYDTNYKSEIINQKSGIKNKRTKSKETKEELYKRMGWK